MNAKKTVHNSRKANAIIYNHNHENNAVTSLTKLHDTGFYAYFVMMNVMMILAKYFYGYDNLIYETKYLG